MLQLHPGGQLVQVPGTLNLGAHGPGQPLGIFIGQQSGLEEPGQVEDPAQGGILAPDSLQEAGQRGTVGHVQAGHANSGSPVLEGLDCLAVLGSVGSSSRNQDQVTDSPPHQPSRQGQAQASGPPGHQPGPVLTRAEGCRWRKLDGDQA